MLNSSFETAPDEVLILLVAAGLGETRCGNIALGQKHWAGALALLRETLGGLKAIQSLSFAKATLVIEGILTPSMPLLTSEIELLTALTRLDIPIARCPLKRRFRRFFGPDIQGWSVREMAFHLANLHMVNALLSCDQYQRSLIELEKLIGAGGAKITASGITFLILQSSVRSGDWYDENSGMRVWETLEFVELVLHAPTSREQVVRAMSAYLSEKSAEFVNLRTLKLEIIDGWRRQHYPLRKTQVQRPLQIQEVSEFTCPD